MRERSKSALTQTSFARTTWRWHGVRRGVAPEWAAMQPRPAEQKRRLRQVARIGNALHRAVTPCHR